MLYFSLGDFVTHPDQPDWGQGQVQSIVGENVTVNFEHAGKQMINVILFILSKSPALSVVNLSAWFVREGVSDLQRSLRRVVAWPFRSLYGTTYGKRLTIGPVCRIIVGETLQCIIAIN